MQPALRITASLSILIVVGLNLLAFTAQEGFGEDFGGDQTEIVSVRVLAMAIALAGVFYAPLAAAGIVLGSAIVGFPEQVLVGDAFNGNDWSNLYSTTQLLLIIPLALLTIGMVVGGGARAANPYVASTPAGSGGTPAGWYPDPQGSGRQRYWTGTTWTEQLS